MSEPVFVPGHRLSEALYQVVREVLSERFPDLGHAAGLIGHGSDVLGFDTPRSVDHDWGPRLHLVLSPADRDRHTEAIMVAVEEALPETLLGVAVDLPGAAETPGTELTQHNTAGRRRPHGVVVTTVDDLQSGLLGEVSRATGWDPATWLAVPTQGLLEFTAGPIHHDGPGELTMARRAVSWFPDDVWRWTMAGRWQRIAQLEAFVGRAGEVGDDLGSRVVAASIVRDVMRLALLQRRRYPAYAKWLGTQFARSEGDDLSLRAPLATALAADTWTARGDALAAALVELGRRHDALGLTEPVELAPSQYFTRPFTVVWSDRIVDALRDAVTDPRLRSLPVVLGGIDEVTDNTLALGNRELRHQIEPIWRTHFDN